MKRGITLILALSLTTVLVTAAEDKPATPTPAAEQKPMDIPGLKDQKERLSYAIGMSIGTSFKRGNYDLDFDVFMTAIKDVLATNTTKMTDAQSREIITTHNKEMAAKREEERKQASETNRKAGDAFLAENAKKEGVKTQTATLPDGTKAEFQYKELKAGDGSVPRTNDMVTVNYRGTLLDGRNSTVRRSAVSPRNLPSIG
jgi:FKBP-type peptidyl-prolyl cis-trans isomerase FklB